MNHRNALWIITRDHVGTGCVGKHSPAVKTQKDKARCEINFCLYDADNELCYTGKVAPECLNDDLTFDGLGHECFIFTAEDGCGPSVKYRHSKKTKTFVEHIQARRVRRQGREFLVELWEELYGKG